MVSRGKRACVSIALGTALLLPGCGDDSESSDPVAAGQAAVATRACATCHQDDSPGILAGSTIPVPETSAYGLNLTPDATGVVEWSDDQLVRAILDGIDDEDELLCPQMPRYRTQGMSTTEAQSIVAYLRTLPAVSREIPESQCPPLKGGE